jgi:hypothetical protein
MNTEYLQFIDSFKNSKQLRYVDIMNIIHASQMYYLYSVVPPPPDYDIWKMKHDICGSIEPDDESNSLRVDDSLRVDESNSLRVDESNSLRVDESNSLRVDESNSLRVNESNSLRVDESNSLRVDESLQDVPVKEKIYIEGTIGNISDLLRVLNTYSLDETKEYNIDLKKLGDIRPELEELNGMIGLEEFKTSIVDQLFYFLQDLHVSHNDTSDFKHTVIYGPPGTGKTEIAKIMGRMFSKIGVLKKNIFKKVVRSDLIAGYLGQTAIKTRNVIQECLGGVLFIDEAYSLVSASGTDSYSQECVDTLCEALSDHKHDLMVIVAGYEDEMKNTFFKANRGLESRFIWRFKINDYTSHELLLIFRKKVDDSGWSLNINGVDIEKWFNSKREHFVHFGRDMEILFLYTKISHARRIYGKPPELRKQITIVDLEAGFKNFCKNTIGKKETTKYPHMYI